MEDEPSVYTVPGEEWTLCYRQIPVPTALVCTSLSPDGASFEWDYPYGPDRKTSDIHQSSPKHVHIS
ncbi:hypothetical protein J6590_034223 [Homalodisca vitripennis]|nr:hypothetical protein J6590_034223 [Homalodisca vitripennis]